MVGAVKVNGVSPHLPPHPTLRRILTACHLPPDSPPPCTHVPAAYLARASGVSRQRVRPSLRSFVSAGSAACGEQWRRRAAASGQVSDGGSLDWQRQQQQRPPRIRWQQCCSGKREAATWHTQQRLPALRLQWRRPAPEAGGCSSGPFLLLAWCSTRGCYRFWVVGQS